MSLTEGIPTIIFGLMAPRILSSRDKAKWLSQQDRDYSHKQLEKDRSPERNQTLKNIYFWSLHEILILDVKKRFA